jgi:hypothetical protein
MLITPLGIEDGMLAMVTDGMLQCMMSKHDHLSFEIDESDASSISNDMMNVTMIVLLNDCYGCYVIFMVIIAIM